MQLQYICELLGAMARIRQKRKKGIEKGTKSKEGWTDLKKSICTNTYNNNNNIKNMKDVRI